MASYSDVPLLSNMSLMVVLFVNVLLENGCDCGTIDYCSFKRISLLCLLNFYYYCYYYQALCTFIL